MNEVTDRGPHQSRAHPSDRTLPGRACQSLIRGEGTFKKGDGSFYSISFAGGIPCYGSSRR
jgi:hypothetical protein